MLIWNCRTCIQTTLGSFFCVDVLHKTNGRTSSKMQTTWGCTLGTMLISLRQLSLLHPLWSGEKQTWVWSSLDLDGQGRCSMCWKLSWVMQSCGLKINLNEVGLTLCTSPRRHQSHITRLHMCEKNASHPCLRLPEYYQEKNQLTAIGLKTASWWYNNRWFVGHI
jgi:hypothetical protein